MTAPQHSPAPGPLVQAEIALPDGAALRPLGLYAKRTRRRAFLIALGYHPLTTATRDLRLSPWAPRGDDRKAPGARCGGCRWFAPLDDEPGLPAGTNRCWINNGERVTRGAATEVRAWWPGCNDWAARP